MTDLASRWWSGNNFQKQDSKPDEGNRTPIEKREHFVLHIQGETGLEEMIHRRHYILKKTYEHSIQIQGNIYH